VDNSIKLFRVAGIDIKMHITFPLILVWGALQFGVLRGQGLSGAFFGVVVTLLLFVIVVLHELGHSFAARRFGVRTRQIVLLPLGGVAQLERIPENAWQEFVIAIAGPAVNFVLAALLFPLLGAFNANPGSLIAALQNLEVGSPAALLAYLYVTNLSLAIFNLIPAFPLDGGRVLRALLAARLPYTTATRIAVAVGQALAFLLGLWGFLGGGIVLILIAAFIYFGASQEGSLVQVRSVLRDVRVQQAFSRQVQVLDASDPIERAIDLTLQSFQADFPVLENGRLAGLLTSTDLLAAVSRRQNGTTVRTIMRTNIRSTTPNEDLFTVQQKLAESGMDALPVLENEQLIGVLTSRDLNEVYRLLSVNPQLLQARGGTTTAATPTRPTS
jgi:Zn-dependent protease